MPFPLALLLHSASVAAASVSVSIPLSAPSTAPTVSPALVSFSIEGDRWLDWSGSTSANQFTLNALNNLKALTGTPPDIRVGANSEDRTLFSASVQSIQETFPSPSANNPYPEASPILVGNNYYAASRFMPSGTHMTWGINFGADNQTAAVDEASSILSAFQSSAVVSAGIALDLIEIGNEPDLYGGTHRNGTWNMQTYVTQWSQFAQAVASAVGIRAGSRPLLSGLALGNSDHGAGGFSPQQAFADGLLSSSAGKLIGLISQHKYSGGCCTALVSDLMSKMFVRGNLSAFSPDIQAVKAAGLKYILGETNSYFNHGVPNVSDAGGAAVWFVDYTLFAATLGIANLFWHEGVGYKYNLIQPVTLNISTEDASPLNPPSPPHIQAPYYGAIAVAEFLGKGPIRSLIELSVSSSSISGYALYGSGGALQKAIFTNSQAFLTGQSSRPTTTVNFNLPSGGPTNMVVKRMSIPHADIKTGLKWGGQTYETSNALVSGTLQTSTVSVSTGITISATEVVLVTFQ